MEKKYKFFIIIPNFMEKKYKIFIIIPNFIEKLSKFTKYYKNIIIYHIYGYNKNCNSLIT